MEENKIEMTSEDALKLIMCGKQLHNFHISGKLDLSEIGKKLISDLIINNCFVENLNAPTAKFSHHVRIEKTVLKKCAFNFAHFYSGVSIESCLFESYLDFSPGGHNGINKLFLIKNTVFNDFVSFYDCWFQGPVEIVNNNFKKGTNLLGNRNQAYEVQFDILPKIEGNKGFLDLDDEGDKIINTIYVNL